MQMLVDGSIPASRQNRFVDCFGLGRSRGFGSGAECKSAPLSLMLNFYTPAIQQMAMTVAGVRIPKQAREPGNLRSFGRDHR